MNKAKLLLMTICLFSIISGVFALKSTKVFHIFYIKTAITGSCTVPHVINYTTIPIPNAFSYVTSIHTAPINTTTAPCPTIRIYTTN